MEIKVLESNHCLATVGSLVVLIWGRETTEAGIAHLAKTIADLARLSPSGVALITMVSEDSAPPAAPNRSALASALKASGTVDNKPGLVRSAVIFEGKGFVAAMVRGVVTGLQLLQRFPFPHQIFDSPESALAWLLQGPPLSSAGGSSGLELLDALRSAREQFERHRKGAR
ncbi:MAG: hypothetical protein U0359_06095 [Byssovorax sp.]